MVDRVEYVSGTAPPIVVGFRPDGAVSFYFGEQPVYQFSAERKLRRVYSSGIVKAEAGRLIRWNKAYQKRGVQMLAVPLDAAEQSIMLSDMQRRLISLREGIHGGTWHPSREVSQPGSDAATRVRVWLEQMPDTFDVADSPRAARKSGSGCDTHASGSGKSSTVI